MRLKGIVASVSQDVMKTFIYYCEVTTNMAPQNQPLEQASLVDMLKGCNTLGEAFETLRGKEVRLDSLEGGGCARTYKCLAGHRDYAVLERTLTSTLGQPKCQVIHPYATNVIYLFS